jgi:arsenate reductase-like glutaredoxin family protein
MKNPPLQVQVFGTLHSNETKKALRFFKERNVTTHFVDLEQRPAAAGELRRFGQKFGWAALIDLKKRIPGRHPPPTGFSESQILPLLEANPVLLVTPLVRSGNQLAIGWDEALWRDFLKSSS